MITKGQKINDRYEIIKSIGEGGMANVYLAHDLILDRDVAIKVLRGDLAGDEKFVRRFQREALAASSLSHPNIVEMYDVGEDNGTYYIVMEYVEGRTLKQLLKKRGNLTTPEVVDIMLQLTDGIAYAHDKYIIHKLPRLTTYLLYICSRMCYNRSALHLLSLMRFHTSCSVPWNGPEFSWFSVDIAAAKHPASS